MYTSHKLAIEHIIEAGRRMYQKGLIVAGDGNISARMEDGSVWATPSGVCKGFMTASDLVRVSMEGEVLEGSGKPSSETGLHLAIYRACPELGGIVHAHPPASTAYSALGRDFDMAISTEVVLSLGVVPCVPYELPASPALARATAAYAPDYNAVLLQSHGSVAWGKDVLAALYRMESAEHSILTWQSMQAMNSAQLLTQAQVQEILELRKKFNISRGGRPKGR